MKVFKGSSKEEPHVQVVSAIASFCDEKFQFKFGKNIFSSSISSGSKAAGAQTDDLAQLPVIVECAQATPLAAKGAIKAVRKRLDPKHASSTASQYNAIMVLRILVDANSQTILNQISEDDKLAPVVKDVLKRSRDPSVRELLATTLEHFAFEKPSTTELAALNKVYSKYVAGGSGSYKNSPSRHEPVSQEKLDDVVEEGKTSASLLRQVVSTTPPVEISGSPLVMEFYERCVQLSTKIQSYLSRDSVPPLDESTIMTLISANDTIGTALEAHKAALDRASSLVSPPRQYYEESHNTELDPTQTSDQPVDLAQRSKESKEEATTNEYENVAEAGLSSESREYRSEHTGSRTGSRESSSVEEAEVHDDVHRSEPVNTNADQRQQVLADPFADDDEDALWEGPPTTASSNPQLQHNPATSNSVAYDG
ncbi:uncharacterized protein V1513DRAFT_158746 [Lipomyces chichibuensis]|uniref:uncharacterized protein n=1 Tax=Lipomyces chichibuensis TaxID=1546026 RepID=UPI0033433BE9